MKNLFNTDRLRLTARQLAALHPHFDADTFLAHALRDLDTLELMDRLRRTAEAFDLAHAPAVRRAAPRPPRPRPADRPRLRRHLDLRTRLAPRPRPTRPRPARAA